MSLHSITTVQKLPISIEKAWDFLSSPANLKTITPDHMGFEITSGYTLGEKMYPGMIITYIVKPIPFIPLKWVTEITHAVTNEYFVDEQRFGPYVLWHHKHFIRAIDGGVEMKDIVHYKIPLGFIGDIMNSLFIKSQLKTIFSFRYKKLNALFGNWEGEKEIIEFKTV